jgi:beta-phosphoglucomutase
MAGMLTDSAAVDAPRAVPHDAPIMAETYGVIFDMDGVLVDSYRAHLRSWQDTAEKFGVGMSDEDFARTFGRTSREIIRAQWPGRFDEAQVGRFDAMKEQRYREILEEDFPEMRGADPLIRALHEAGFRLAIGSSGPPENVQLVKRKLHGGELFEATVNGSEVKHGKPEPDVFLIAARKLGLEPRNCAVIEDAVPGLEAAKRAGMAAIAVLGTAPREQLAARADLVVDSLHNLTPQQIAALLLVR